MTDLIDRLKAATIVLNAESPTEDCLSAAERDLIVAALKYFETPTHELEVALSDVYAAGRKAGVTWD